MTSIQIPLWLIFLLVIVALLFDFMNGFHDAANSIATVVSTGVLKAQHAVVFAALCNITAYFIFHLKVASTVGHGTIDPYIVDNYIILAALVGAISWNIITWIYGIPSSSSHALIGGLVGSSIAKAGFGSLNMHGLLTTVIFIFLSPFLGFILGSLFMVIVSRLCFRTSPSKVDRYFRRLQLWSAGFYSLGHGGNDAQKTIGIIWMMLMANGYVSNVATAPPIWVVIACYLAIGLGTLFGGWRIVHTMGQRITKLKPVGGFCAEAGGSITLFIASFLGIPVSTTHTITGAIVGVGSMRKISAVRWGVARRIVYAWILTIPSSGMMAAGSWYLAHYLL